MNDPTLGKRLVAEGVWVEYAEEIYRIIPSI